MSGKDKKREQRQITGKAKRLIEAYKLRGAGMDTAAFFERYGGDFSKNSYYQWRHKIEGFADAWDRLAAENVTKGSDGTPLEDRSELLSPRLARWLEYYEDSGNRATACQLADITTTEIEESLETSEEFSKRKKELDTLWDWDVEDSLRAEARNGTVAAQKEWLKSKVPDFKNRLDIGIDQRIHVAFPAVEKAKKRLVQAMGEYKSLPPAEEEDDEDVIDV